jgi:hypothetical protein
MFSKFIPLQDTWSSHERRRREGWWVPVACGESRREGKHREQRQDEAPEVTLLVQFRAILLLDVEGLRLDEIQAVLPVLHSFEIQMRIPVGEQSDLGDVLPEDGALVLEVDASEGSLEGVHIVRGH